MRIGKKGFDALIRYKEGFNAEAGPGPKLENELDKCIIFYPSISSYCT